jgi:hypothetical protein
MSLNFLFSVLQLFIQQEKNVMNGQDHCLGYQEQP